LAALDLTTYAGLKDTVAQYLNRRDLTDQVPAFIAQAEAKFNRELRVREMQTRAQATTHGEYIAVPGDYLAPYSLELATQPRCWGEPLTFVTEQKAKELRAADPGGTDFRWYTTFGSEFELVFAPSTDYDFRLKYYARVPALATSNVSNWLLVKSPDLYVVGACLEASVFLKNDERLATWNAIRQKIIDDMNVESERSLKPQGALTATRRTFG
jgi:hypothetical protein